MSFEDELRDQFSNSDLARTMGDGSLPDVRARARQRTMRARIATGVAVIAFGVVGGVGLASSWSGGDAQQVEMLDDGDTVSRRSATPGDVSEADISYVGAFLVPVLEPDREGSDRFGFGGRAAAVDPQGDPESTDDFPGSMFIAGFPNNPQVAEISIPTPQAHNGDSDGLPVAELLQPFADITDGRADTYVGSREVGGLDVYRLGGLEVVDGPGGRRLHWTAWQDQDTGDHDNPGHGHSSLDLSAPDPQGPWYLGDLEGYQSAGYLFEVPEDFADDALGGRQLVSGFQIPQATNSASSRGAPFFAFTPPATGDPEARIAEPLELANYDIDRPAPGYSDTQSTPGAAWVSTSDGRSAIVTVGNANAATGGGCPADEIPLDSYGPTVSFYNPVDLAAVAAGEIQANDIAPYRTWDPSEHLIQTCGLQITSISVDAEAGRVYIVQIFADVSQSEFAFAPVMHVFDLS